MLWILPLAASSFLNFPFGIAGVYSFIKITVTLVDRCGLLKAAFFLF